uniref:Fibronectin type-III domain-containing protein n=1 Tax=Sphenodon punctatus TaxID=8508 RepID=A0A8D0HNP4_SPHPU
RVNFTFGKWSLFSLSLVPPEIPIIDQAYSKLSNSITVEWAAVPGATSYLLTAQDGESFIETIVTNSPGTVTGLKAATLYKITIRATNSGGRSLPSLSKKTILMPCRRNMANGICNRIF